MNHQYKQERKNKLVMTTSGHFSTCLVIDFLLHRYTNFIQILCWIRLGKVRIESGYNLDKVITFSPKDVLDNLGA